MHMQGEGPAPSLYEVLGARQHSKNHDIRGSVWEEFAGPGICENGCFFTGNFAIFRKSLKGLDIWGDIWPRAPDPSCNVQMYHIRRNVGL